MLRAFALTCLFAAGLAKPAAVLLSPLAASPASPPSETIVALAQSNPDLSTFVIALKAAGLVDTLSGNGFFTVFAPSNKAFAALPKGALLNLLRPRNKAQLVKLLTYHVVAKDLKLRSNDKSGVYIQATAVEGDQINICNLGINDRGTIFVQPKCGPSASCVLPVASSTCINPSGRAPTAGCYDAQVLSPRLYATNGLLLTVDAVLTIPNTLYFHAINAAGSNPSQYSCGDVDAAPFMPATLFEPSNAAELKEYADITAALYDQGPVGPDGTRKLAAGQCKDVGFNKLVGSRQATWEPPVLMGPICLKKCKCRFPGYAPSPAAMNATTSRGRHLLFGPPSPPPACTDQPDHPTKGTFCSLCGPKYNRNVFITIFSRSPPPAPPAPPVPPANQCNPAVGTGCNVCAGCCEAYIPNGASCDACVAKRCAASNTIVDLAVATPDLSTLVAALKAGSLVDTLSGPGPFTVFAPSNEAFAALPAGAVANLLKPANKAQLVDLLTYHVISGDLRAKDLKDGQMLKTVEGKSLTVRIVGSTVLINSAKVTAADVEASNGVVHVIDGVLMP